MFWNYLDRFRDDPGYNLKYPMTAKVVGTSSDNPETIPVDRGLPQYHSHMFQNHLGQLQSDPDISIALRTLSFASTKPSTILAF